MPSAAADEEPESTMLPPGATATLESGEVVVTGLPWASVLVMMAAGAMEEVVMVWPRELVVVRVTMTLVGAAPVSKAEVVWMTVLPLSSVDVIWTGMRTPVCVLRSDVTSETVGAVMGLVAFSVEDTGMSVVVGCPRLLVVDTSIEVAAAEEDGEPCS